MGGDSKGSSSAKRYNYFGTLAGAVCVGPVDTLTEVIVDGKSIWSGTANRSGDTPADLTAGIASKYFYDSTSYLKFHFGTSGQTADSGLTDVPDFRGIAYIVAKGFLFGKDKTTAPNIEVICIRKPVADGTLVDPGDNTLDDGQINPVAALVELLTSNHGAGLAVSAFDASAWIAAGAYAKANKDRCYCSPLLAEAQDLRNAATELLAMVDAALAWTAAGLLTIKLLKPGTNPGGLATLTGDLALDNPTLSVNSWGDVPTTAVVTYFDRARSYKRADESVDNLVARKLRGENHTATVDRPFVTRRSQASGLAADLIRKAGQPVMTASMHVRAETAGTLGPGDKVLLDIDPEPISATLPQLAIVEDRRDDAAGKTTLKLIVDPLTSNSVTAGTFTDPVVPVVTVPDMANALVIPLPIKAPGWQTASIGILATRPSAVVTQMRVYFDVDADTGDFADLGIQTGFACRLTIASNFTITATSASLTLTDGATGPDAYLAGQLPNKLVDAKADKVLIVFATVDANGRVTVTGGVPDMEICSVVTRVAVTSTNHTYTILRARKTTRARAWTTSDKAWLIPANNLVAWSHPDIGALIQSGGVGYARLIAMSANTESASAYERTFVMPSSYNVLPVISWTTPSNNVGFTTAGSITPSISVADSDSNLVALRVDSTKDDGSSPTNHADLTFASTGSRSWSASISFGVGVWFLTVTATDLNGNATVSTRIIQNDNAGANMHVPQCSPGSGAVFTGSQVVTITVTAPANRYEYVVDYVGSAAPGGSGTAVVATSGTVTLDDTRRLWVRSGDGTTWSAWVFADYYGA